LHFTIAYKKLTGTRTSTSGVTNRVLLLLVSYESRMISYTDEDQVSQDLFGSTQFLRNWFMRIGMVPNILFMPQFIGIKFSVS
jgi:hypothetical protein